MNRKIAYVIFMVVSIMATLACGTTNTLDDPSIISYTADPKTQNIKFYWKDEEKKLLRNIQALKDHLATKNEKLIFAMNGGMYMEDNTPLGLFIQDHKKIRSLNTSTGYGNFYMKPNGVFYITNDNTAVVCKTNNFKLGPNIKFATQSGPMLVVDGEIHSAFKQGSENFNIRNGVGILPDGKIIFAISKTEINFYDFANYFKKAGCKNALYMDGFVSRMYLPEKNWKQLDGNFGVMIAISETLK